MVPVRSCRFFIRAHLNYFSLSPSLSLQSSPPSSLSPRCATIWSSFLNACALYSIRRALAVIRRGEESLARLLSVIIRQVVINWKPGSDKAESGTQRSLSAASIPAAFFRSKVSLLNRGRSPENPSPEYSFHLRVAAEMFSRINRMNKTTIPSEIFPRILLM